MANLVVQLEEAFGSVTAETCSGLIKKIRRIENKFWEEDALLDDQTWIPTALSALQAP